MDSYKTILNFAAEEDMMQILEIINKIYAEIYPQNNLPEVRVLRNDKQGFQPVTVIVYEGDDEDIDFPVAILKYFLKPQHTAVFMVQGEYMDDGCEAFELFKSKKGEFKLYELEQKWERGREVEI